MELVEHTVEEKFGWIEDWLGDRGAVELLLDNCSSRDKGLELLRSFDEEHVEDDMVGWFLEANTAFDALKSFMLVGLITEWKIDEIVEAEGLCDWETAECFESYEEFCAWRAS